MPGSARRDAVAQAFDRSAAEFDPLLWHAALLEALCAPGAAAAKHASEMARLADRLLDHHGGAEVVRLLLTEWARREDGGAAGGSGGARGEKALLWDPLRAALQGSLPPAAMPHGLRLAAFLPAAAPHRPLAVAIFVHPFHYLPRAHVMRAAAVNAAFGLALLAALGGAGTHAPSTPLPCRFCLVTVDGGCGFERQGMLDVGAALRAIRFDRLAPVPLPAYPADPHVTPASLRRHLEQQCALILARRDQDHQGQQRTHAPAPPRIRALRAVRDPRCTAEMRGLMRDEAERGLMRDEAERGLMRDEAERGLMRVMASGEHVIAFLEGESEPLVLSAVPLAEDDQEHEEQEQEARELLLEVEEEEDRRVREAEERMLSELFPVVDVVDGEEGG